VSGEHGPDRHAASLKLYAAVFAALLVLTFVTVSAALHDFGALNTPIALGIASVKATLVILYFMHVRWSERLTWIFVGLGILFLAILLGFTLSDYVTRDWMQIYGPELGQGVAPR
jgi:cytochrome c oxidase subunit 4